MLHLINGLIICVITLILGLTTHCIPVVETAERPESEVRTTDKVLHVQSMRIKLSGYAKDLLDIKVSLKF